MGSLTRRKKDMGYFDDYFYNDQVETEVKVKGQNHTGMFSPNNPYVEQLNVATNRKDRDALYAQAVEWEADQSNLQQQTDLEYAKLQEQRAYDSDVQRVARARQAGINLDVQSGSGPAGVGSSGSSASMGSTHMADQNADVKYSNAYDNTAKAISVAETVLGGISSLASIFTNSFATMKRLPSEINLLESQSRASDAQAGLSSAQAHNVNLDSSLQELNIAEQIANRVSDDATDDDISSLIKLFTDNVEKYLPAVKHIKNSARVRAPKISFTKQLNNDLAFNKVYNDEVLLGTHQLGLAVNLMNKRDTLNRNTISARISSILKNSDYAKNVAGASVLGSQNELIGSSLQLGYLVNDFRSFYGALYDKVEAVRYADSAIQDIYDKAKADNRQLDSLDYMRIQVLTNRKNAISTLGSEQIFSLYDMLQDFAFTDFNSEVFSSSDIEGYDLETMSEFINRINLWNSSIFRNIVDGGVTRSDMLFHYDSKYATEVMEANGNKMSLAMIASGAMNTMGFIAGRPTTGPSKSITTTYRNGKRGLNMTGKTITTYNPALE